MQLRSCAAALNDFRTMLVQTGMVLKNKLDEKYSYDIRHNTSVENKTRTNRLKQYLPILSWLPHYKAEWLRFDMIAALSVWALLVPQGIAYASIAGVPAQYGLYAALGALLGYALFGTSGQVITGPSAAIAAVSAAVIALWATSGTPEWISYTAALALTAGLVYLLLGWFKMGWVSHFISGAVLGGFVFGFGIGLIVDQTPKILGVPKASGSYFEVLIGAIKALPETSIPTLIVGASSIILLLLMRRFLPKLPRTIIVVILGIIVSSMLGLADYGVSVVGTVPTGLPSIIWPSFPPVSLTTLILGSLAVIFIGFSESLAAAKEESSKYDYEIDTSQEMVAQGMANAASGMVGGFAVEGSLSKTTVADLAGQKTQLASLVCAGLILLTILFLADFFTTLPQAVLGAVVIDAGISLIKFKEFQHYRLSRRDFAAFLTTALVVFFIGVLAGVVAGIIISLLLLIVSASRSPTRLMAFDKEQDVFVHADHHPEAELIPGIVVAGIHGPLFFADVDNFHNSVMHLVQENQPKTLVIDMSAVIMMDIDGDKILTKLSRELRKKNVQVLLVNIGSDNLELMRKTGTLEEIGSQNIYRTVRAAVANAQKATAEPLKA
jgi:high affinity sulfate transporter 1